MSKRRAAWRRRPAAFAFLLSERRLKEGTCMEHQIPEAVRALMAIMAWRIV